MIQGCGRPVTKRELEKWQSCVNNILLFLKGIVEISFIHDDDSSQCSG